MCSREPPGPVEGAPINPQRYVPLHEIIYEMGEIAIMKNDDSWVVGLGTVELGIAIPPLSIVVSFWIYNAIYVVLGHHGEADIAHEYAKSKMRLLSGLEGLYFCAIFYTHTCRENGTLFVTEADSVL